MCSSHDRVDDDDDVDELDDVDNVDDDDDDDDDNGYGCVIVLDGDDYHECQTGSLTNISYSAKIYWQYAMWLCSHVKPQRVAAVAPASLVAVTLAN